MYDAFAAYQADKEFEVYLIAQQNKENLVSAWCEESEKIFSQEIGEVLGEDLSN